MTVEASIVFNSCQSELQQSDATIWSITLEASFTIIIFL